MRTAGTFRPVDWAAKYFKNMSQASSLEEHETDELVLSQTVDSNQAKKADKESPRKTLKILSRSKKIQKSSRPDLKKKRTPDVELRSISA